MKKTTILVTVMLCLALASCGRPVETKTADEPTKYYFTFVPEGWSLPPIEWAEFQNFEILKRQDCWIEEKFVIEDTKIDFETYDCNAEIDGNLFFRVTMNDGSVRYYELMSYWDSEGEWIISSNTI